MAWRALVNPDDLESVLSAAEYSVMDTLSKDAGVASVIDEEFEKITDEARGYIASCKRNTVGAADTLPERVIYHAMVLVRHRLASRLRGIKQTEERRDEWRSAERFFRDVAACKFEVEQPTTAGPAEEQGNSGADHSIAVVWPNGVTRTRRATRDTMAGL